MIVKLLDKVKRLSRPSPDAAIKDWTKKLIPSKQDRGNILITALKNGTWIEWGVYSAFVLKQLGFHTTLLYKSSEINRQYRQSSFWKTVLQTPFITLVDIDGFQADQDIIKSYREMKPLFLYDAVAYQHHLEREDINSNPADYAESLADLIRDSAKGYAAIQSALKQKTYHRFICYSGLIQMTPTLLNAAIDAGVETACVEGWAWRAGHVIYNFNKPALEYNLKGWIHHHGWGPDQNKAIEEYIAFQDGREVKEVKWLNTFYNVQQSKINTGINDRIQNFLDKHPGSFLLAPNVIGDSSTLNRETIFKSLKDWMEKVIRYFKSHPQHSLIIRAHPAEVWAKSKVKIQLGEYAEELSKGSDNILIIKGDEKINSFSLFPYVKCGLVWVSSIGVDLVVRGIPVICAASPQYGQLGFVLEPKSEDEYFVTLNEFAKSPLQPTSEHQKTEARKYLHVVFKGFSFPAQGSDFTAKTLKLNQMPSQADHDRFYNILIGDAARPDANT